MNDLNNGMLIARLTKDSEIGYLQSGSAKLDFSVAFSTSKKNGNEWIKETNYLNNLTLWGRQAESLQPYLKKGVLVGLLYHLKVDTYEKDGQKKSILKTVIDDIQLLGGKKEGNNSVQNNNSVPKFQPVNEEDNGSGFPEDIPF